MLFTAALDVPCSNVRSVRTSEYGRNQGVRTLKFSSLIPLHPLFYSSEAPLSVLFNRLTHPIFHLHGLRQLINKLHGLNTHRYHFPNQAHNIFFVV
jgi:hypothetical protein